MVVGQKRNVEPNDASNSKKQKISSSETPVRRDLLERCYARVITLREYVLANLPRGSRLRRKKVASIGHGGNSGEVEKRLSQLLDTSLVCCQEQPQDSDDTRWEQWLVFSQKEDESYVTLSDGVAGSIYSQSEIVDFVVWLLFSRDLKAGRRPKHLLCDGFRKSAGPGDQGSTNIPGLFSLYPNCHVKMLREAPWPQLLALLGKAGEKIMIDLLVDASVFVNVEAGFNNYYQLTGIPLSELDLPGGAVSLGKASANECRKPSDITLVDTSKTAQKFQDYTLREEEIAPAFQPKTGQTAVQTPKIPKRLRGDAEQLVERLQVRHGRCSYIELLKYYCPCVFDKPSRSRKPRTKKDAITPHMTRHNQPSMTVSHHKAGPFHKHSGKPSATQVPNLPHYKSLVDLAAPASQVSTFCQAVLSKIIPHKFWGGEEVQKHNESVVMQRVDHFIKLRRFETMPLHEISQNLKVTNIDWLQPPGLKDQKPSKTDTEKRHEIFDEFLYFIFDSLLIPLIRNNFYVTESNTHRYQIFYFRHEVWKHIAEPAMANLKADMFEEIKLDDALHVLQSRRLGFSQVRLLPKGDKMRPIMNLRRRALTRGTSKVLGPSINSILGPVHTLLKLEKDTNPSKLGSTMFSVSDIYTRLKTFKESLGPRHGKLYFAKIDVKAAFDTIPQPAVIKLMGSVPRQAKYTIVKHAEVKPGERALLDGEKSSSKAIRRWHATALAEGDSSNFTTRLEQDLAGKKKNTVFVDSAMQKTHSVGELLHLLTQHVEQNLVKVGKKYYRQKVGIPQGSVLSSFLCNYFYADLEKQHLDFLDAPDTLLLRLIDDFLLVTLDQEKAVNFVNTMHKGVPEYVVVVNPAKTLVNFDMSCAGVSA
ncbi:telomerase reverse transcriptase, partial [Fusarium albosuccineum]